MKWFRLILVLTLATALCACGGGGGGSTSLIGGLDGGADALRSGAPGGAVGSFTLPDMPGTVPPEPRDAQSVIDRVRWQAEDSFALSGAAKGASGVIGSLPDGTVATTAAYPDPGCHAYAVSSPFDAQGVPSVSIGGTLTIDPTDNWASAYAQLGLVTEATYQYAMDPNGDGDTSDAQPQYMFNQNVLLTFGLDDLAQPRASLTDFNNSQGYWTHPYILGSSFSYELVLTPNNGGTGGLATLDVDGSGTPIGPQPYGTNNWGWWPAEDFSQARLVVQVYTLNPGVSAGSYPNVSYSGSQVVSGFSGPPVENWSMFRGEATRSGVSPFDGPRSSNLRWSQSLGSVNLYGSPTVAPDGTVYQGSWDGNLYALDQDSNVLWSFPTGDQVWSSPAIGHDGTVYVGSDSDELIAVNPDGSFKWSYAAGGDVFTSPAIGEDGLVYGASKSGKLFALNPVDGTEVYSINLGGELWSSPAVAPDGTVYIGSTNSSVYAVRYDNSPSTWVVAGQFLTGDSVSSTPAIGPDGTIYVGSFDGHLYALNDNGAMDGTALSEKWAYNAGDGYSVSLRIFASPAIDWINNQVYCTSYNLSTNNEGEIFCLDTDGNELWRNDGIGGIGYQSSPIVDASGYVYVGGHDGYIYCYEPTAGNIEWSYNTGTGYTWSSPTIGPDGTMYIANGQGHTLYAFNDAAAGTETIDCTAFSGASFTLYRRDSGEVFSGPHTTAAPLALAGTYDGLQLYIEFAPGSAGDTAVFPPRPDGEAGGYIEVNNGGFTIVDGDGYGEPLSDYFTVTGNTLSLSANAYTRVTNDLTSLSGAYYTLMTPEFELDGMQVQPRTITNPLTTDLSDLDTVALAAGTRYYPYLAPNPASADELIYPAYPVDGWVTVEAGGTLAFGGSGADALYSLIGAGTSASGYETCELGATYCRFEADPTTLTGIAGLANDYGFLDATTHSWIVQPGPAGFDAAPHPLQRAIFAVGTQFIVRDSTGAMSPVIAVDSGTTLDTLTEVTRTVGAGEIVLRTQLTPRTVIICDPASVSYGHADAGSITHPVDGAVPVDRAAYNMYNDLTLLYGAPMVDVFNYNVDGFLTPGELDAYDIIAWVLDSPVVNAAYPGGEQLPGGFPTGLNITWGSSKSNYEEIYNQAYNNGKTLAIVGSCIHWVGASNYHYDLLSGGDMRDIVPFPFNGSTTPWGYNSGWAYRFHGFHSNVESSPNNVYGFTNWVDDWYGQPAQCVRWNNTNPDVTKCVYGWGADPTLASGAYRLNIGPNSGRSVQVIVNYGDMEAWHMDGAVQGTNDPDDPADTPIHRSLLLENLLYMDGNYVEAESNGNPPTYSPPTAVLAHGAGEGTGPAPHTVNFNASGSTAVAPATIVKYELDYEGDGIWDAENTTGLFAVSYTVDGTYNAVLRVTDSNMAYSIDSAVITVSSVIPNPHQWPMYGFSAQHTGNAGYLGPQTNNLDWTVNISVQPYTSPAIAQDGTVYAAGGATDSIMTAYDTAGNQLWAVSTGLAATSSPAITTDGTVYIGNVGGVLYATNPDGTPKWTFATGGTIQSSPTIGSDGTVYFGSYDNNLYALNPDGTLKWSYATGGRVVGAPALASDGTVYVGSHDHMLHAVNPDGTGAWTLNAGGRIDRAATVAPDGSIYFGSRDFKVYALNPDGTVQWTFMTGNQLFNSPALADDGTIYAGSNDGFMYAINPDGFQQWAYNAGMSINSSAVVGSDGTVYFGADDISGPLDGLVIALNPDGTLKWQDNLGSNDRVLSRPALSQDGTMYVSVYSTGGDKLVAYKDSALQPPVAALSGPSFGTIGVSVSFDATGSSDPDGTIVLYELDVNDDGIYEYSNATGLFSHTYTVANVYNVNVRVTDNDGLTDTLGSPSPFQIWIAPF